MKVLLDACIWRGAKHELLKSGHDVVWVEEVAPALPDEGVLLLALEQERILVTLDKDFGKLSVRDKHPHRGIVRLVEIHPLQHAVVAAQVIENYADVLLAGAVIVVKGSKIRVHGMNFDQP